MSLTGRGRKWELVNSLWVLGAALPVLYGFAWIWAGETARRRQWTAFGIVLLLADIVALQVIGLMYVYVFLLVLPAVSLVLALSVRKRYLLLREAELVNAPVRREELRARILSEYGGTCADARFQDRGKGWICFNSLWLLLAFIPLGNILVFFCAAIGAHRLKWMLFGYAHVAAMCGAFMIFYFTRESGMYFTTVGIIMVVGVVQAFRLWQEYMIRRDAVLRMKPIRQEQTNETLRKSVASNTGTQKRPERKRGGSRTVKLPAFLTGADSTKQAANAGEDAAVPVTSTLTQAGVNDSSEPVREPAPLLDLNRCTEQQLAALPGVGIVLAKKAVRLRDEKGGFESPKDFAAALELKPHFAAQIETSCTATRTAAPRSGGRVLDI